MKPGDLVKDNHAAFLKFFKRLFGIDKLEKKVDQLEAQLKVVSDRAQMNNLRTLMMLEYGEFSDLKKRMPNDS
jgi:hypothetical protein